MSTDLHTFRVEVSQTSKTIYEVRAASPSDIIDLFAAEDIVPETWAIVREDDGYEEITFIREVGA